MQVNTEILRLLAEKFASLAHDTEDESIIEIRVCKKTNKISIDDVDIDCFFDEAPKTLTPAKPSRMTTRAQALKNNGKVFASPEDEVLAISRMSKVDPGKFSIENYCFSSPDSSLDTAAKRSPSLLRSTPPRKLDIAWDVSDEVEEDFEFSQQNHVYSQLKKGEDGISK